MVDPDAPSPTDPQARSWVHWLLVNVPGTQIAQGRELEAYSEPTPPLGSGYHRYVLLAYEQPGQISPTYSGISGFNVQNFVITNNLVQPPTAGNFFRAQDDATPTTSASTPSTTKPSSSEKTTANPSSSAKTTAKPNSSTMTTAKPSSSEKTTANPSSSAKTTAKPNSSATTTVKTSSSAETTANLSSSATTTCREFVDASHYDCSYWRETDRSSWKLDDLKPRLGDDHKRWTSEHFMMPAC
ncbi:Phosphatidylethanolamine-binding protein PEBP [Aphelenchoides avenae]|nr:Phosphatidylethanolamine-binding protein PEBP [Aphelenchus avenae]